MNLLAIAHGWEQTVAFQLNSFVSQTGAYIVTFKRLPIVAVLVGLACATALAQASDPLVGTWKLNPEKSKGTYKSGTSVFEAAGDGIKGTVDLAAADGTAYHWTFEAKYDGKDTPVTGNSPYGDSMALTRVNPNTVKITVKQAGKEVATQTIVVAADGKTRTTTTKGKNAKGESLDGMSFYEKQ
jgi:hypothetical protein